MNELGVCERGTDESEKEEMCESLRLGLERVLYLCAGDKEDGESVWSFSLRPASVLRSRSARPSCVLQFPHTEINGIHRRVLPREPFFYVSLIGARGTYGILWKLRQVAARTRTGPAELNLSVGS